MSKFIHCLQAWLYCQKQNQNNTLRNFNKKIKELEDILNSNQDITNTYGQAKFTILQYNDEVTFTGFTFESEEDIYVLPFGWFISNTDSTDSVYLTHVEGEDSGEINLPEISDGQFTFKEFPYEDMPQFTGEYISNGKILEKPLTINISLLFDAIDTLANELDLGNDLSKFPLNTATVEELAQYPDVQIIYPNKHDYVEIAGIKWAKTNIGATTETEFGKYFQWADTEGYYPDQVGNAEGKKYFGLKDYKYYDWQGEGEYQYLDIRITKYNDTDKLRTLEDSDNAAIVNWGEEWTIPTSSDFYALRDATNAEKITNYNDSGVDGWLFTDKNDPTKFVFFPLAGDGYNGHVNYNEGYYWANGCRNISADGINFYGNSISQGSIKRYMGLSIRPIKK